jgi:hypothetical protein
VPEARLEDSGSGLAPVTDGWFVVNVRDAEWWTVGGEDSGADCPFESEEHAGFPQLGIRLHIVQPGEPSGVYHAEPDQEAFLVLSGSAGCSSRVRNGSCGRGTFSTVRLGPSTSSSARATARA